MNHTAMKAAALTVALMGISCGKETPAAPPEESLSVKVVVVKEESVPREISCFGTITFTRKIDISATVDGTIARQFAREGQAVKEGQRLLTLRNVQLELRRQQALSAIDSARASLDLAAARLWEGELGVEARLVSVQRTLLEREQKRLEAEDAAQNLANKEELSKVGGVTAEALSAMRLRLQAARNEHAMIQKDLESRTIGLRDEDLERDGQAPAADPATRTRQLVALNTKTLKAEVEAAKARFESARRELEASEELLKALAIDAPAAGIVGAKYVEQGEYVAQNGKLLTLMDTKNVYAALSVQESEMPLLREGMPAQLSVEALSSRLLSGAVSSISPSADPQTGAFLVKVTLSNSEGRLRPGMFIRATISYDKPKMALVIPEKCIIQKKGSAAQVFGVVNGKAFLKSVTLGADLGGAFSAEKGLKKGDLIIEAPPPTLREGMNVEATN